MARSAIRGAPRDFDYDAGPEAQRRDGARDVIVGLVLRKARLE
jgi:hypothetical protein